MMAEPESDPIMDKLVENIVDVVSENVRVCPNCENDEWIDDPSNWVEAFITEYIDEELKLFDAAKLTALMEDYQEKICSALKEPMSYQTDCADLIGDYLSDFKDEIINLTGLAEMDAEKFVCISKKEYNDLKSDRVISDKLRDAHIEQCYSSEIK